MPAPTGLRSSTSARTDRSPSCRGTNCSGAPRRSRRRLRSHGVTAGDRVVGYLPNIPEAVIAFLATASIGAIWSACGQDYSAKAALDRLGQLEPVVLVTADGYRYGGKSHDKRDDVAALRAGLPTLRATVLASELTAEADTRRTRNGARRFRPSAVDPVLVGHHRAAEGNRARPRRRCARALESRCTAIGYRRDDTFFWYTSPSWMMWNFQVAGLLVGATIVCYDGSPSYPRPDALWDIASRVGATVLGTSPGYVLGCAKAGAVPRTEHDLSALRTVGITGSSLPPSSSLWLRDNVGDQVQVASISGGTDVVSAFIGGVRTVPVWPGELSAPFLGVALDAWDESGKPVRGEVGELVITKPMPSMPVAFWNDADGSPLSQRLFRDVPRRLAARRLDHDHRPRQHHRARTVGLDAEPPRHPDGQRRHLSGRRAAAGDRRGVGDRRRTTRRRLLDAAVRGARRRRRADRRAARPDQATRSATRSRRGTCPTRSSSPRVFRTPAPARSSRCRSRSCSQGADSAKVVERSAVDDPALLDWYAKLKR